VTPAEQYIDVLTRLKPGDLGLLRTHAGRGIDESVQAFDLFAGLWWPLRAKNQKAPRREVAWLIAKLYAFRQIQPSTGYYLASLMGHCQPKNEQARKRHRQRFDRLLILPIRKIEPALEWALDWVGSNSLRLDWVKLTDDLSIWERESKRLEWAEQFLQTDERKQSC
jgi:hypothetical protein